MATTTKKPVDDTAAHQKAKEDFIHSFQGTVLKLPTVFHNRPVIRAYRRTFMMVMRNWYMCTTLARSVLKDQGMSQKLQDGMLANITRAEAKLKKHLGVLQAVQANEGNIDMSLASHGNSYSDQVILLGPVAMKFRSLLLLADEVLDLATVLFTYGALPDKELQSIAFEIKGLLRGVDSSARNYRIGLLKKINEGGGARPGYKAGDDAAEANPQDAAGTEGKAPSEVGADPAQPAAAANDLPATAAGAPIAEAA